MSVGTYRLGNKLPGSNLSLNSCCLSTCIHWSVHFYGFAYALVNPYILYALVNPYENDGHLPYHKITQYSIVVNTILLSNPRYCQYTTIVNNDTCPREQPDLGNIYKTTQHTKNISHLHCEKYFTTLYTVNYFTNCK